MSTLEALYLHHFNTLTARYDSVLQECGYSALQIYSGHAPAAFLDDQHYPFKANPHFKAFLPAKQDYAQSWVVYEPGQRPNLYLYLPNDYWHSYPALDNDIWNNSFEIHIVDSLENMPTNIARDGRVACIGELAAIHSCWPIGDINPDPLLQRLHWYRAEKSAFEIECMAEANRIAAVAHMAALQAFNEGESEYGIHLAYCKAAGQDGAQLPYENLISINQHGAILHYSSRGKDTTTPRLSFLIDAGATYRGYCADITRTYAKHEGLFADLIIALNKLQLSIVGQVRAGDEYTDLHRRTHRGICNILSAFDIVNCDADTAFQEGISEVFFPHGLGHFLGIQVHDIGGRQKAPDGGITPPPANYPALRTTRTMAEGQVLTIEPGIYFIDALLTPLRQSSNSYLVNWDRVDTLRPYGGIRIEDDIVVRAQGEPRNLTREAFAKL